MANALKLHAVVVGKTLPLPDLSTFEGKRVEVIVVEEDASERPARARRFGTLAGKIDIAADFDAPLPDDIQAPVRAALETADELVLSVASVWEIAIKVKLGNSRCKEPPRRLDARWLARQADEAMRQCGTTIQWAL